MNKMVNGKQCTILWHVDDIKVSHEDATVVTTVLEQTDAVYGKESPLTVTRGKIHDYLGMKIDFDIPGKVQFTMIDYIQSLLDELAESMDIGESISVTPAADHLFTVDTETEPK